MTTKVYLSTVGAPVEPEAATVSVLDRGFLYGDSVYETMRTAGPRVVELDRHLARLRRSAAGIGLELPFTDPELARAIEETRHATGDPDSTIRLMITRGVGPVMLDPRRAHSPLLVVLVQELVLPTTEQYAAGVRAVIVDIQKTGAGLLDPTIKSGNYLNNIQALRQAIERSGDDAILCNADGDVAEGATSNVFMVAGGRLATPHLATGLLPGITREVVCELGRDIGIEVEERTITPAELRTAAEIFLTSSVRGIMPVTRLDGRAVGEAGMGPVTRRLQGRYQRYIDEYSR